MRPFSHHAASHVLSAVLCAGLGLLILAVPTNGQTTKSATTRPASQPAQSQPAAAATMPTTVPDELVPVRFEVFDRPSDDGSALLVKWPIPAHAPKGVEFGYVVEIARSPKDFLTNNFKTQDVEVSPKALASAKPDYFGKHPENKRFYFCEICPADLFAPEKEFELTGATLDEFAAKRVITDGIVVRANKILATTAPDEKITEAERGERKWLRRLEGYLKKQDADEQKAERERVNAETYYFRLAVTVGGQKSYVTKAGEPLTLEARAVPQWFKWNWLNNLAFAMIFCGIVVVFIQVAKRNPNLFIRKIGGLESIDEAIGRSTEMGKPVFFVHGLGGVSDPATIASVNILSRVAGRSAESGSQIRVMNNDPIVTAVSQEVVQQACIQAGRPDAYKVDDVALVAYDQFSYVAAVAGSMVREQPGAIFLLGSFFAESLLLAETGASTGAIQVAGTDAYEQLPFFITTCDYTLIGEELYAASAYLSREPRQLGSLRGQDVGKAFLMGVMVAGSLALTLAGWLAARGWNVDLTWLRELFRPAGG